MSAPRRIVVMGPAGSGKTAVGAALAVDLAVDFVDADDLHPDANVAKMSAGIALDDADRWPWLDVVGRTLAALPGGGVVACSALARRYRDRIRAAAPGVVFVELLVDRDELARRMHAREHFMPPALLDSQVAALEHLGADERGFALPNSGSVLEVAAAALAQLDALARTAETAPIDPDPSSTR
ncbi:gluconokinase [Microbacterium lacticum]